ncbi:2-hydroxy-3-oxopropionate reductase [Palleronia marisminoris]|uniref:2-hydroxy-3-oxopropionate reductase n=1 Tax=Palleronia marisminoris TaxID=315423 RepID=A0A1Y5TR04_9RHOB|nr:2-hydroxy-3-oxopropionate reductase [Palleronia marisminoris]SFH49178.1 2-hydroxy-3-oxopropionate reductase [Palleronia marisminoris]SLN69865.1 2-hydroxy-3-oxopropionate reductase [Palleronia marisminoris]
MDIGFIGLGVMGQPMAGHLIAAGHQLHLHRVKDRSRPLVEQGGLAADSARAVADAAEVIIVMVPDTPDVEDVLFGPDGVAEGLSPGKTVIDMSSISPVATRDFAARIAEAGCAYVDAPVSGGEAGAKAASLSIMAGGAQADFDRILPILEIMGQNINLVGEVGAGQTAKIANQIIVALTIGAVAEGLLFASKAGADPAKVRSALMGGLASSRILELHGARMTDRTFDPGFRIALHRKDVNNALEAARSLNITLPATAQVQELFKACTAHGFGDLDHSALIRALEMMSDHEIGG